MYVCMNAIISTNNDKLIKYNYRTAIHKYLCKVTVTLWAQVLKQSTFYTHASLGGKSHDLLSVYLAPSSRQRSTPQFQPHQTASRKTFGQWRASCRVRSPRWELWRCRDCRGVTAGHCGAWCLGALEWKQNLCDFTVQHNNSISYPKNSVSDSCRRCAFYGIQA